MTDDSRYCVVLTTPAVGRGTRAALLERTAWTRGEEITVAFLDGDPGLRQRVQEFAEEWTGPAVANLTFQFVPGDVADIRIAFEQGAGSWSYLGTVCRQIPEAQQTMNYGWLTPESSDEDVARVVRHEFGHALGLVHEHQNPNTPIRWNRDAVIAELSQPPNSWSPETIEHNIFDRERPEDLASTPTDVLSIMMYPIPAAWTLDGFTAGLNTEFSDTDRDFIRGAYPW